MPIGQLCKRWRYNKNNKITNHILLNNHQKRFPSVVALCSDVAIEADNHATAAVEEINNASNDIAKVLGLSVSEIDLDSPLIGFGLDSLTAVEISSILAVKWKVVYTSMELLGETTTMGSILKKCELVN